MRRGRKPYAQPGSLATTSLKALPRCPSHLNDVAYKEWRRLATPLHEAGILTLADRSVLAAYCQAYARWVEAEENSPRRPLLKTPSGYVQQSPWLAVANKQMELMGRFMAELGLTPAARSRLGLESAPNADPITKIELVTVFPGDRSDQDQNRGHPDR